MIRAALLAMAVLALAACGEKRQTIGQNSGHDAAASSGTGTVFQVQGWKAGDRAAWEQQLKSRAQAQNDYVRVN
ncbi:MAG TPA: hypothetical protein VGF26_30450 [Ramlibacter sp.]